MSSYRNPILPGFHPDPSICRVGEDYYLVTSTFAYFPAVPIFHSRDLVNWRQIGNCLTRASQLVVPDCGINAGIWAPCLRHYGGRFYVATTVMNRGKGRNFFVTADDPAGPWSDPTWVDQPGIDPDLFLDLDGRCYFLTSGEMPGDNRRGIGISEIDLATGKRLSDIRVAWYGTGGLAPEGPHLYCINGWYYLMIAEGGTYAGHMETMARSRSPWGPYESCPRNPILTHRNDHHLPIQDTGHADLVQLPDGAWWMVHLGVRRTHYGMQHLGRETYLTPVTWDSDGWPALNGGKGMTDLVGEAPSLPPHPWPAEPMRDDFRNAALSMKWNHIANPTPSHYDLEARPGWLRLVGSGISLDSTASPTFVGRRQQHWRMTATTRMDFAPPADTAEAGMTAFMSPAARYDLFVTLRDGVRMVVMRQRLDRLDVEIARLPLDAGSVELRITGEKAFYRMSYRQGEGAWQDLGEAATRYLCAEVAGTFTGVYIGLYATAGGGAEVTADFNWFDYVPDESQSEG